MDDNKKAPGLSIWIIYKRHIHKYLSYTFWVMDYIYNINREEISFFLAQNLQDECWKVAHGIFFEASHGKGPLTVLGGPWKEQQTSEWPTAITYPVPMSYIRPSQFNKKKFFLCSQWSSQAGNEKDGQIRLPLPVTSCNMES